MAVVDDVTVYQVQCDPIEYEFWECARRGGRLRPSGTRNFLVSTWTATSWTTTTGRACVTITSPAR